jgi:hypothetical protein
VEIEGELYRIRECAEHMVDMLSQNDGLLSACLDNHGRESVINQMEKIMRKKLGDESSGTFKLNGNRLHDCVDACQRYFFSLTVQKMLSSDALELSLDKEGQICFTTKREQ